MKNNYQHIKKEISETVLRVNAADAMQNQQEEDCQRRYDDAQEAMSAAIKAEDREAYRKAAMDADNAQRELRILQESRERIRTPGATWDDDRRIQAVLFAEEHSIRSETLARLKALYTEAAAICTEAQNRLNEIDNISRQWNSTVMKKPQGTHFPGDTKLAIFQFASVINGQLQRFNYMKGV